MYTLTYGSQAVKDLNGSQMDEILKTARSFNSENGITGCLIYYMGATL